jgi:lipopolysaccharide export LptBFGC system permease protein LptF
MANSIKKSCLQSELLVMFSLGLKPIKMFKIYIVSSIFLAIFLLIIGLGVRPLSEYLNTKFIHDTETTQSINLSKSDFGQKFGNWFFFINKENDTFKNIILFNKGKNKDTIVIADEVKIGDNKNSFELQMRNGKAYISSNNELVQINYDKMSVFDSIIIDKFDYSNLIEYWKRYKIDNTILKHLVLGVNIALFPIFSIYGIFGIAFIKPRISKDKVGIYSFYYIASFVFLIHLFLSYIGIWTIVVIPILFTLASYVIYWLRMR